MKTLVMMACSGAKREVASPAFDLYRGVMYETFRAHVKAHARPQVIILSALHGFIDPAKIIAPYDQKMTSYRADEMIDDLTQFMKGPYWPLDIDQVFFAGGKNYRRVMRAAISRIAPMVEIEESSGGIGMQRSQLGRYLDQLCRQHVDTIGHHPNGTPLFDSFGEFKVGDLVHTSYRSVPCAPKRPAVITELFNGPRRPTAAIELLDQKPGRKLGRWIALDDLVHSEKT